MSHPNESDKPAADAQRDQLAESERKANEQQPRNWKEDAIQDKKVEIRPGADGGEAAPIQGLDP
jgi:hypothetical protein